MQLRYSVVIVCQEV